MVEKLSSRTKAAIDAMSEGEAKLFHVKPVTERFFMPCVKPQEFKDFDEWLKQALSDKNDFVFNQLQPLQEFLHEMGVQKNLSIFTQFSQLELSKAQAMHLIESELVETIVPNQIPQDF